MQPVLKIVLQMVVVRGRPDDGANHLTSVPYLIHVDGTHNHIGRKVLSCDTQQCPTMANSSTQWTHALLLLLA